MSHCTCADRAVQGPFYILVPSGRTVTLSSTVPLIFETAAGSAPGAMVVANNGNQFVSASFTAAPATLPTQLNLSEPLTMMSSNAPYFFAHYTRMWSKMLKPKRTLQLIVFDLELEMRKVCSCHIC